MLYESFYNRLPRHKIELVDGQTLISGSLDVSRMVLESILQGYGPGYIQPLVGTELLREACIEAFGRGHSTDAEVTPCPEVAPTMPVARMASELMMSLYTLDRYGVMGRDIVVKLGEDAFTPDVYVYRDPADPQQTSYYFDGAPDLLIEVIHPDTRTFDTGLRLQRYRAAGVSEIWLIDYEGETITAYRHRSNSYATHVVEAEAPLVSEVLPGVTLHPTRLWKVKADPWQNYFDLVTLDEAAAGPARQKTRKVNKDTSGEDDLPFSPDIGLAPTPVHFEQFIAWAPEAKFEWMDDRPHIGGGTDTNLHLTGLLLMTIGLTEAVRLLPSDAWSPYL